MSDTLHIEHSRDGIPMPRRIWAILAVAFGVSLSVIDATIANVALPTIARELGISSADWPSSPSPRSAAPSPDRCRPLC